MPRRPMATAVPIPVPRISVGYTFAASAYMVVSTAFSAPPRSTSRTISWNVSCGSGGSVAIASALARAIPERVSIVVREPRR